jgi:hypothetical protein
MPESLAASCRGTHKQPSSGGTRISTYSVHNTNMHSKWFQIFSSAHWPSSYLVCLFRHLACISVWCSADDRSGRFTQRNTLWLTMPSGFRKSSCVTYPHPLNRRDLSICVQAVLVAASLFFLFLLQYSFLLLHHHLLPTRESRELAFRSDQGSPRMHDTKQQEGEKHWACIKAVHVCFVRQHRIARLEAFGKFIESKDDADLSRYQHRKKPCDGYSQ